MNKNKIYELLSEGKITDAVSTLLEELEGPELDNEAKELKNVATEESKPEVSAEKVDNQDVYPADEHKETEEVKEVVVESDQVAAGPELKEPKELENEATEERKPEEDNLEKDNQDVYPADEHKETEEVKEVVVEDSVVEDILDSNPEAEKAEDNFDNPEQVAPTASETAEEVEKLLDVNPAEAPKDVELSESMKAIFSILDKINESAQVAAGPELKEPKELENEATEENKPEVSAEDKDNQDVYPADEHKETEEVKEVVVEGAKWERLGYDSYSDYLLDHPEEEEHVKKLKKKAKRANRQNSEAIEQGNLKPVKITEEVDNVATEEKAPETMEQNIDNKDVYNAPEHKEVEEVVEVVVEAAKLCSENGVPATLENITKYAKTLFESEAVALNVEVPADKEYDVDAAIESSEMNGNKKEFKEYEEIQGDGAEAAKAEESVVEPKDLHETVKYTSLREACLLDEDYFVSDSYTIQTADEKQAKLTEQISLLMAREAMDPLYDELLRASTNAQRLQEACVRKYSTKAKEKAKNITRGSGENNTLNEGKVGNFLLRGCVRFLSEKSLNKILNSAKAKLSGYGNNPKAEEELLKVQNALDSSDKKNKKICNIIIFKKCKS